MGHAIYIPMVLAVGVFIGWMLGSRGSQQTIDQLRDDLESQEQELARYRLADASVDLRSQAPEPMSDDSDS
jgi:hypothetical protein